MAQIILEDLSPEKCKEYFERRRLLHQQQMEEEKVQANIQKRRYRCEQTVISKLNDIINNDIQTKREFVVSHTNTQGTPVISVSMTDNILICNPPTLQETAELLLSVDNVKCKHVVVTINKKKRKNS